MSDRTGLGALELVALRAVQGIGGSATAAYRRSTRVLDELDRKGFGQRYTYLLLQDLVAPWRLHVPLLAGNGNWGSRFGDPAADARYTEVRLSPAGELALAAEAGEVGPVPLGLIEGSLYRDGPVPPFAPADVLAALRGERKPLRPVLPTGGIVGGEVDALLAGRKARLSLSCTIVREPTGRGGEQLVILEMLPGVGVKVLVDLVRSRLSWFARTHRIDGTPLPPRPAAPFVDVHDHDQSSSRHGLRIVCVPHAATDLDEAEAWLRSVWPVTTQVDCRLPTPMRRRLGEFDVGDGSGLDALAALVQLD